MNCFIYDWDILSKNPVVIQGFALLNNHPILLKILNYHPWCYSKLRPEDIYRVCSRNRIPIIMAKSVRIKTSRCLLYPKYLSKVVFPNYNIMTLFLEKTGFSDSYMHEVGEISMITADNHLEYTGWIHVKKFTHIGNIYMISSFDQIKFLDITTETLPKIMTFDIECQVSQGTGMPRSYNPNDRIEMISIIFFTRNQTLDQILLYIAHSEETVIKTDEFVQVLPMYSELDLIKKFFTIIEEYNPIVITGYNIYGFDFKYILDRLRFYLHPLPNISPEKGNVTKITKTDWESSAYGYNSYDKLVLPGIIIVDLFLFFKRFKLEKYSLDYVSQKYLGTTKDDMSYGLMWKAFESRDIKILENVARYCIKDSSLVMELFNKFNLWEDVCEMSRSMRCRIEDIYTRGEQHKVLNQVVMECISRNIVLTPLIKRRDSWNTYSGAHVISPKKGVYNKCCVLDFQSLYPSILIAFNICPSVYDSNGLDVHEIKISETRVHKFSKRIVGILPGLVNNLLQKRISVKKQLGMIPNDSYEKIILDRRQNALKVCANSVYGIMGFERNIYFGMIECAESVTHMGRYFLEEISSYIPQNFPVDIIYGDTDSVMIIPNSYECQDFSSVAQIISKQVTATLPRPMALNFESYYDKIILMSKKRYILYHNGNLKYKGVMSARRGYCQYAKDIYNDTIMSIFLGKSNDKIISDIDMTIYQLLQGNIGLDKLSMTKSIKNIGDYKIEPPHVHLAKRLISLGHEILPGSRIEYLFVTKGKKQGEKMYILSEIISENLPIDYLYYIKHQVASQLDDLLDIIGYNKYVTNITKKLEFLYVM